MSESVSWDSNAKVLEHPVSEFNARGGLDLADYQASKNHMTDAHPTMGADQWEVEKQKIPEAEYYTGSNGQSLRYQRYNWPENDVRDQTVTVLNMPFSVAIGQDHVDYQNLLVAEVLGTPVIVLENPGNGKKGGPKSDDFTPQQKRALWRGNFGPIATTMLEGIQQLGIKKLNCIGYSMGAEISAAIAANAAEFSISVGQLFVMEAPRVEKQNPVRLGVNFASGLNSLKFAWDNPIDPVLKEVASLKGAQQHGSLAYGMAMTKGGLQSDLERALYTQPRLELILGNAGASTISPSKANAQLANNLRTSYPLRKIGVNLVPGETHLFRDSGHQYAMMAKLAMQPTVEHVH